MAARGIVMSLSAPAPPDPVATANAQEGMNKATATWQNELNQTNQTTPYGTQTYQQTGTRSDGSPIFASTTQLNAPEQKLFDTAVNTQQGVGNAANKLIGNLGGMLSTAPNLGNDALIAKEMGWTNNFLQPTFNTQTSNLNSNLAAQGITQGSDAWNNAERGLSQGQSGTETSALSQFLPEAFNQSLAAYQAPINTLGTLLGESQPGNVASSLTSAPQAQIQPANLEGLVQQDYQFQNQNYANTMSGIFGIGDALAGGWAKAGFASDIRLKTDISIVGHLRDGTPVHRFRYKGDPRMQIGLIAQDIVATKPDAVFKGDDGFFRVDYERATDNCVSRDG